MGKYAQEVIHSLINGILSLDIIFSSVTLMGKGIGHNENLCFVRCAAPCS